MSRGHLCLLTLSFGSDGKPRDNVLNFIEEKDITSVPKDQGGKV